MKRLDNLRRHAAWLFLFPLALMAWSSCSDDGVSAAPDGSLCSSGTLCKGGMRILAAGQWWDEIQYDTLVSTLDSVGRPPITRRVYTEHHKHTEVLSANEINREWIYQIQTRDTLVRPGNPLGDSISIDTAFFRHGDTLVEYSIPMDGNFIDTLKFAALKLPPLGSGHQWTVLSETIDSATRLGDTTGFSFPATIHLDLNSNGDYGSNDPCNFDGKTYVCRTVNRSTNFDFSATSDTVLVFIDTLVWRGDTIAVSNSHSDQEEHFNFDLSAAIWSREVETKLDTNYIDSTSNRENIIKYKYLTRYFDPRRSL